ncbi:DNA polymerase III subunit delta [Candidatus Falkowbacteria bacterium]|nr:DNA polymerase III subunit delta [Candidatus Falkowbacteria bacterium]
MIIFLYGEDTYRSTQKLEELKAKFNREVDSTNMNLVTLDGAKLKFEEFNQQVKAAPFLARKRMIIIKNLISENKSKEIQKEIVNMLDQELKSDDGNIIIFWEGISGPESKSKDALWKRLVKEKFAQAFFLLKPMEINSWITKEVENRGGKIDRNAVNLLGALAGNDLWQMSNEIAKLINFVQGKIITSLDVENLVKAKFDENIFNLIDALGNKNKKLALKLLSDQFELETHPLELLSSLIWQFRILLLAKDLQKDNPRISQWQIAQQLAIHPFVAKKSFERLKNFSLEQLKTIYNELLQIDYKIKTSNLNPQLFFDLLIAQI